ncbi:Serine/threonine protein kinase [Microbacterium testaceum StLB037]|uniref:non-specific serine/threonine protein kinase n=1 Tax=Microbacterium testaceum (strain StLB037) TaxID=979556 RepID=A0A1H0NWQ2_MICTS|nr:serine/threonine-protein kinase [Microbacterium testaceum]SDO97101.1 Serine/threonine protein kinase [Microbacterium testaceum StLB037]
MSLSSDHAMPHAGDILGGRYILRERIGAGGMGRVFRARDEVLARDVAIKIFYADAADEPEPFRRMSEARALAALAHPSLVTLYDARLTGDDQVYLVMELVDGPSLQRRIEQGPLASAEVAGIVADLAAALTVVHDAGIVHRDVKPSNVLLRPVRGGVRSHEAVLADFGVARLIGATRLTTPGTVIGTAAYLAPEQVRGEAPRAASDVYALGLLAIEALTRLHPFGGGTLQETLLARLARQPEIPGSYGFEWQSLLTSMTAFDPDERPTAANVVERAEALAFETGETVTAAPAASWAMPTALTTAPVTPPAARAEPVAPVGAAAMSTTLPRSNAETTAPVSAAASVGAGSVPATSARAPRSRRRRVLWAGAAAGAALVIGGHVMAFSLGAGSDMTTDRVSTPAPSSTPGPVVAENVPSSVEPVSNTDAETPPPAKDPGTSQPTQPSPAPPVVEAPGGGVSQPGQGSPGSGGSAVVDPAPDTPAPGGDTAVPTPSTSPSPGASTGTAPGAGAPGKGNGNGNGKGNGANNGKGPGAGQIADVPAN